MKKGKMMFQSFYRANKYVLKKAPIKYCLFILLSMAEILSSIALLKFAEFTTNAAKRIITGESLGLQVEIQSGCIILGIILVSFILLALRDSVRRRIDVQIDIDGDTDILKKLSVIPWENYESHKENVKINDVKTKSIESIKNILDKTSSMGVGGISLIIYGSMLFAVNPIAVLIYAVMVGVSCSISGKLVGKISGIWDEIQPLNLKEKYFFGLSGDKVGHQEYRFNRMFKFTSEKWEELHDQQYKLKMKLFKKYEISFQLLRIIVNIPFIFMLIVLSFGVVMGKYEIGFLVMAQLMLNNIVNSIGTIQWSLASSASHCKFVQGFFHILSKNDDRISTSEPIEDLKGDIVFKKIGYSYPQSSKKILEDFDLRIIQGEKISLVGKNGSGKSTFTNIMMALTDNFTGDIAVGNTMDREKVTNYLRNSTACIFQDFIQYQMTIKENIAMGNVKEDISDEKIEAILKKVQMWDYVKNLPDGINTKLGRINGGTELSKGQWQRIAVGRLLADEKKKIWILDEPTAYLDPLSEIAVYNLIYELAGDRTVIFISHRLGFSKNSDRVIVMKDGKITEDGHHNKLMGNMGEYSKMYNLQKGWVI